LLSKSSEEGILPNLVNGLSITECKDPWICMIDLSFQFQLHVFIL
jgi:hypothetical protein